MNQRKRLNAIRSRRKRRTRKQLGGGTAARPRLSVFRSHIHIYAQLIDDAWGKTIAVASSRDIKEKKKKVDTAAVVGRSIALQAREQGIKRVIFDRGGYRYHGRVKALAAGAREGGLEF